MTEERTTMTYGEVAEKLQDRFEKIGPEMTAIRGQMAEVELNKAALQTKLDSFIGERNQIIGQLQILDQLSKQATPTEAPSIDEAGG